MSSFSYDEIPSVYAYKCIDGLTAMADEFGKTLDSFIRETGVKPTGIIRTLNNGNLPPLKVLIYIADYYNITMDELLDRRLK